VAYVQKSSKDNYTGNNNQSLNQSWIGQFTVPTSQPITLQSIDGGVTGTDTLTVYDVPASVAGLVNNIIANVPGNPAFTYNTIELAFNKRFQAGLFLDMSYDYTKLSDLESPYQADTGDPLQQSDEITPPDYFENPYPTVSNLQKTSNWEFHLSSRYELPLQIGIGANFQVQSGFPYAR